MLVLDCKAIIKKSQAQAINEAIRTAQFVRNQVLKYWMDNRSGGKKELYQYNTQLRPEYQFVGKLNSHACQVSGKNVEGAINRFFNPSITIGVNSWTPLNFDKFKNKKPEKQGDIRFKKNCRSVEYKVSRWKLNSNKGRINFTDKKGIGELKLLGKWDIHTFPIDSIEQVRLCARADRYYVKFCVKTDNRQDAPDTDAEVGIDVGLEYFYCDSNGDREENPRVLRKAEKDIKPSQRQMYQKKKGSSHRRKARGVYGRKHLRVTRQRKEHAKRLAHHLCQANAKVVLEDLSVSGLARNHKLPKSISDASWYQFRRWLEYLGRKFSREVIAVAPHFTSIECSKCGAKVRKTLSNRTHSCPHCVYVQQRNVNAAKVILSRASPRQCVARVFPAVATAATGEQPGSDASGKASSTSVGSKTYQGQERR